MQKDQRPLEQITVRRAKIADTDKVRYRVYKDPVEFIAVIAESALMAVKVSGIPKPYKIVRDMPTDGVAVEAKKMEKIADNPERVPITMAQSPITKKLVADLKPLTTKGKETTFQAMNLGDLQRKRRGPPASILPPELLHEIIEQHLSTTGAAPQPAPEIPAPAPAVVEQQPPAEPALPDDHPLQMVKTALTDPDAMIAQGPDLSTEEVDKLLNG